jgi:hypothetical protein
MSVLATMALRGAFTLHDVELWAMRGSPPSSLSCSPPLGAPEEDALQPEENVPDIS